MFNLQPQLSGELLYLRPLLTADFEALFSVASDPLIWEQHPENTRYQREVFQRFFQGALDSRGAFVVVDAKTQEVIGSSRFTGLNLEKNQVEVGYTFLARRCWGKGYNFEMKKLMLRHAFQYVGRVVFLVGEKNLRSRRAVEKIGARLMEQFERSSAGGKKLVTVVYGLVEGEYVPEGK